MRVLQIIDSLATGGAEKLLLDSIPLYRQKGIQMDLLVLKDENYPFMQQLEALNCCKIYKLGSGSVYNPIHIFKISKIIRNYPIVHVHLFPAQYWAVLAKIFGAVETKLVFTEHNTTNRRLEYRILKPIDVWFYKRYSTIVAISKEIETIIINHTKLTNNIRIIENGIDVEKYQNAIPYKTSTIYPDYKNGDIILMQVSAFREQKDQMTLMRSMQFLNENVKLVLVGVGSLMEKHKKWAETKSWANRIHFLGQRTDIPNLLKTADVVILSSKYEGLSLASLEGMASGKPFVASDVSGLRNVVKDAGLLFKQGNAEQLASIVENLTTDQKLYDDVVISSLKRAHEYDINKMVDKYIDLYKELND